MYVTYELLQEKPDTAVSPQPDRSAVLRSAKEFRVPGNVESWEVGEFALVSGKRAIGVRVNYAKDTAGSGPHLEAETIELPDGARNVQVREELPEEYREGLDAAA